MTTLGASSSSASLVWSSPVLIDRASLPPRPATSDGLRPAALWSRGSDSGSLYGSAEPPATCVQVRSPVHGVITLNQLQPDVTIGDLKALVAERIGLSPARRIHLSTWGHEMLDRLSLAQCRVKTNGVLDMRLSLVRLEDMERPMLERVRIFCTCLETRTLAVDRMTTILDLKQRIQNFFACGEHEWYNKKGERSAAYGTTVLVKEALKADEKTGTEAFGVGEELVTAAPLKGVGEGKGGKPIPVLRVRKGTPASISDGSIVLLDLQPEKQRLSFHGQTLDDHACLWSLGVRQDDAICLEFASPTMPQKLQVVRAPDKPKEKKGKGGKKKK